MHFDEEIKRNTRVTEIIQMHGLDGPSSFNMIKPRRLGSRSPFASIFAPIYYMLALWQDNRSRL